MTTTLPPTRLADAIALPKPTGTAKKSAPKRTKTLEDDEDDEGLEVRSVDSDDAGSLVDFVVDEEEEDGASVESDGPANEEESRERDLDGMDTNNIISGKRTRRQTKFYEQTLFQTEEYRRMMLEDVPPEELHAVEESSEDEAVDEDDESYEEGGPDDDSKDEDSDDEEKD